MKNLLFLIAFSFFYHAGYCCCAGERYTFTEIILSKGGRAIIKVQVDSTWKDSKDAFVSRAYVLRTYKGEPLSKTIYIHSGGNSSAGGSRLKEGEQFLVVGGTNDHIHYYAFVCDSFSRHLDSRRHRYREWSLDHLEAVNHFFDKLESNYTGEIEIKAKNLLYAKGKMINGMPDGEWIHYTAKKDSEGEIKTKWKSKAFYKNGNLHGQNFDRQLFQKYTIESHYTDGLLDKQISYNTRNDNLKKIFQEDNYQRNDGLIYKHQLRWASQDTLSIEKSIVFFDSEYKYKRSPFKIPEILHGINKRYTSDGLLKSEGNYFYGAKVGWWTYFDEEGMMKSEIEYPKPIEVKDSICFYFDNGSIKLKGEIESSLPCGEWIEYNQEGQIIKKANFENGLLNGQMKTYKNNDLYSVQDYVDSREHGKYLLFNKNHISVLGEYEQGRKHGGFYHYRNDTLISIENYKIGDKHGDFIKFNINGDTILHQEYYEGKKHGKWEVRERSWSIAEGYFEKGSRVGYWEIKYPTLGYSMTGEYENNGNKYQNYPMKNESIKYYDFSGLEITAEAFYKDYKEKYRASFKQE